MNMKSIFRWLKFGILIYCITGIALYYLQDYILFHPVAVNRNQPYSFSIPFKEFNVPYDRSSNLNIVQFQVADSVPKGVVLYFHGNRKNISWYSRFVPAFTKNNYEVWMLDYPGFGKSTGIFTEKRLDDYALQMYKLARTRFAPVNIIIYGKSMGTGIAAELSAIRDSRQLILETPYFSFESMVRHYFPIYPVSQMLHYKFPTYEYLPKVTCPVTIIHGTDDGVIPYNNALRLKEQLKKTDVFVTIDGGSHNDLDQFPLFKHTLDSLLEQ